MVLTLQEMETERLNLRPVELADACDLMAVYGDQTVMKGNSMEPALENIDDLLDYLADYDLNWQRLHVPPTMALEEKTTGRVIGIIHYFNLQYETAELGYLLAKDHWNQGLMSEALQKMIQAGFEQLKLHRIVVQYDPENIASARILAKQGFVIEGVMRKALKLNDGYYHDLVCCAMLKEEYEQRRKMK